MPIKNQFVFGPRMRNASDSTRRVISSTQNHFCIRGLASQVDSSSFSDHRDPELCVAENSIFGDTQLRQHKAPVRGDNNSDDHIRCNNLFSNDHESNTNVISDMYHHDNVRLQRVP